MEETGNSMKKVPLRETNVIQEYLDGMAIKELAEKYDRSHQSIGQFLRRQGIETEKRIQTKSPYTLDEHWLDELDCEEKWYFLGFFYADGVNSIDRNQIRVKLNIRDIDMLELFQSWFKSNRPLLPLDKDGEVYTYNDCKELALTSGHLCKRLLELGAPNAKTTILKFPNWIPDDAMNHFLRGYFDGDGNIFVFPKSKNSGLRANITIVGSHDFISGLDKYFEKKFKIKSNVYPHENYVNLKIEKAQDLKVFLDWLYQDATCFMSRKYDKAIEFLKGRDFSIETSYEKRNRIEKDIENLVERYNNGETISTLAKEYDCSINAMSRHLKKHGVVLRKNVPPKRTKKKIE